MRPFIFTAIIIVIALCNYPAYAQRITRRKQLPKGYVYRNLRLPYTNTTQKYVVQKVPVKKGSKYSYYLLGDIIVGSDKPRAIISAIPDPSSVLWKGDVPLKVDQSILDSGMCQSLITAINDLHMNTKIRLVPYSNQPDFIAIQVGEPGANKGGWSAIGRVTGEQEIVMRRGASSSSITHELLHALGVIHEHQRPDRDTFLRFNKQNLIDPILASEFGIWPGAPMLTPYDYSSVMHYSSSAMARKGTLTLECKNNNQIVLCPASMSGSRLSEYDAIGLNDLYKNVAFSTSVYTSPRNNLPSSGNNKGTVYISWDYKEVQMRRTMDDGDRLIMVTAKNAFKLKVIAPGSIINFNKCVWAYANYANYLPVINYSSGTEYNAVPPGRPTHIDTITYASMKMLQLSMPFEQLSITLDVNEAAWTAGKTNNNPYGKHGMFLVWLLPDRADNEIQSYKVHGRWLDDRDIQGSIRRVINNISRESVRRRIISDGPMSNPDGYGPGNPR